MRAVDWLRQRIHTQPRWARKSRGRKPDSLVPRLEAKRLEERRLLNAEGVPVDLLVIDAGNAANDGAADVIQVEYESDTIRVLVNGDEAYAGAHDRYSTIQINGSGDDDVLIADLMASVRLVFDGGGGNDTLQVQSSESFESVFYELHGGAEGELRAENPGNVAQIEFHSVENIADSVVASQREFSLHGSDQQITLSNNSNGGGTLAVADGVSINFHTPTDSLRVDTTEAILGGANHLSIDGWQSPDVDLLVAGSRVDSLSIVGHNDIGSGDMHVATGSISLDGSLQSSGSTIDWQAAAEIDVTTSASLINEAGHVSLDAGAEGTTHVDGVIDVSQLALDGQGGLVHVLGQHVQLGEGARIDASGLVAGGTILIGGALAGADPTIRNAQTTFVQNGATIRTDGVGTGSGGRVVIWADLSTRFHGLVTARGGSDGGDGGFIEISGKQGLVFGGWADASAPAGNAGTLLFDPENITINAAATGDTDDNQDLTDNNGELTEGTVGAGGDFVIDEATIESLGATFNIVLEATNNITLNELVSDLLSITGAGNSITITADSDGDGNGSFIMAGATGDDEIRTNGGDITINAAGIQIDAANANTDVLNANGGTVTINNSGVGTIEGDIAGAGDFVKNGAGTLTLSGTSTYTGGTTVNAGRLNVTGELGGTSGVSIAGGTLGGTGTIDAPITMTAAGGSIAPGVSPGILTVDGDVTFNMAGSFDVELNGTTPGTEHDQLRVTGGNRTVTLNDATLNITVGGVLSDGDTFVIISNVAGSSTIMGEFGNAPAGGQVGNLPFFINYAGGSGNDVVVTFDVTPDLAGTNGDDIFIVDMVGTDVRVRLAGNTILQTQASLLTSLTINGGTGDDLLTVDHSNGFVDLDITFDGGGDDDALVVMGDSLDDTAVYTPGATTGTGTVVVGDGGANSMNVEFLNLEPVDITGMLTATLASGGAVDLLTLTDGFDSATGLIPSLVVSGTTDAVAIESAHFFGNTNVIIDVNNVAGADVVTINSAANGFTNLTIESGGTIVDGAGSSTTIAGNATLTAATSITLGNDAGDVFSAAGKVSLAGGVINVGAAGTFNAGTLCFNTTAAVTIVEASSTVLSATSTAGSLSLSSTTGSITDDGTADVTVTGNASFDSVADLAITLDDTYRFGTLTFDGGAVTIVEANATVLSGTSNATTLDLDTTGSITDNASADVTITGNANFNSVTDAAITLNATHSFGSLTFDGGAVLIIEADATVLSGTSNATTLNLSSTTGSITDDGTASVTVTSNANFNSVPDLAITLDDTYNFGTLTFDGGAVTIVEAGATVLAGASNATTLSLSSTTGSITDNNTASLTVTGNATFDSVADLAITLNDTYNFGTLTFDGGAVTIVEASATVLSGTSSATTLNLSSTTGSITDDNTAIVTVTGNARFDSVADLAITLNDTYNFGTLTFDGGAVTIIEASATVLAGTSNATTLNLSSTTGSITDNNTAIVTVTGNARFDSVADLAITLNDTYNFGTLTFDGGSVTIVEASATVLAGTSNATTLDLDSTGSITDNNTAVVTVTGNANFNSTTDAAITLNDTYNFGTLTFDGGAVTIIEASATVLAGTSNATTLVLTSTTGSITDDGTANLTVTGNANFNSVPDLAITLDDTYNFGTLTFDGGPVTISEASPTVLAGTSNATILGLTSTGSITDATGTTLTVSGLATLMATSITLGDNAGDAINFNMLDATATTGGISVRETDGIQLGTIIGVTDVSIRTGGNMSTTAGDNIIGDNITLTVDPSGLLSVDADTLITADTNTTLISDRMDLASTAGNSISAGAAGVLLVQTATNGRAIELGSAATDDTAALATVLGLSDVELLALDVASGTIQFGTATNRGAITVTNAALPLTINGPLSFFATTFELAAAGDALFTNNTLLINATQHIRDAAGADTTLDLMATDATLIAGTGIGQSPTDAIDTSFSNLQATNATSGGIFIHEISGLTINGTGVRTLAGNGTVYIDVDALGLTINSVVTAHGSGSVTLNADAGTVDINAIVSSTTGALAVSGNAVTQDANLVTTGVGTIGVVADTTSITMADGTSSTTGSGTITYTAAMNVALSRVTTTGSVNISATAGAITDNTLLEGNNAEGGAVTLTAATGIGSGTGLLGDTADIEIDATTLAATNTTSGLIQIREANSVGLLAVSNLTRNVVLDAAGALTDANAGAVNILAAGATLRAGMGIGTTGAGAIDTTIDTLQATNLNDSNAGQVNGIFIHETTGLTVNGTGVLNLDPGGAISLDVDSAGLTIGSVVTASGAGNVTLNADDGTVTVNAVVSSGTGALGVTGNAVAQNANLTTTGTGTITVTADTTDITMADNGSTSATTGTGLITYTAAMNVALSRVATGGNVNVTATSGAISDNTLLEGNNAEGAVVTFLAAMGIGSGTGDLNEAADIEINASTLNATNSTLGAIQIREADSVALGSVSNTGRDVVLDAVGAITEGNAAGTLNITAGDAVLRAGTGIGTGVAAIDTSIVRLEAAGGTGGLFLINQAALEIANVSTILIGVSATNNVRITTISGDLTANQIVVSTAESVTLTATVDSLRLNAAVTGDENVTGTAGTDVNVAAAVTATNQNVALTAGNDALVNAAVTAGTDVTAMATRHVTTGVAAPITGGQNVTATAGMDLTSGSQITATAQDATLTAGNDAMINAGVTAGTDVIATATAGNLTTGAAAPITGGMNVTATAGMNLTTNSQVTATAQDANLTAGNDAMLNAGVTAGTDVMATATTGNLTTGVAAPLLGGQNVTATAGTNLTTGSQITATVQDATLTAAIDAMINAGVTAGMDIMATATTGNLTTGAAAPLLGGQNVTATAGTNLTTGSQITATALDASLMAGNHAMITAGVTAGNDVMAVATTGNLTTSAAAPVTGGQNVTATAGNNLSVAAPVTATAMAVGLEAGQTLGIATNVTANTMVNLSFDANSAVPSISNFAFASGNLTTSMGTVNAALFTISGSGVVRYNALDASGANIGNPDITNGATAIIDVISPGGAEFTLGIDWREANGVVSVSGPFPGGVVPVTLPGLPPGTPQPLATNLSQVIETEYGTINTVGTFTHTFFANPDGADAEFIDIVVRVANFVGGTVAINAGIANTPLQDVAQPAGSLGANLGPGTMVNFGTQQMGIMAVIRLEVQPFLVGEAIPLPESLPETTPIDTIPISVALPTPPANFINVQAPLPSTPGSATQTEERYYELRIVSITQDGEIEEPTGDRIDLDSPELKAINPNGEKFNPSKLPTLFKRLPADRYRIYLIEDGTERLVLEFVIEQAGGEGRPVELPERIESNVNPSVPGTPAVGETLPIPENRAADNAPEWDGLESDGPVRTSTFAEQLSRTSFVASGGLMFGAAMMSQAARRKRAARADGRMAEFARCRRRLVTSTTTSNSPSED